MTLQSLHNIAHKFGISEHNAHKILLRQGNIIGCQLLGFVEGKLVVEESYCDKLIAADMFFKKAVVSRDEIYSKANTTIPFDLKPRIYFLLDGNVIVYVGMTNGICARMAPHIESKVFDKVSTFATDKSNLFIIEAVNILHYTPCFNKTMWSPEDYFREIIKFSHGRELKNELAEIKIKKPNKGE